MERLLIAGQKVSLKHTIILGWIFILLFPMLSVIAAPQRSKYRRQAAAKTLEVSNVPRVDSDDGGIWYPTIDVDYDEFVTADSSSGQNTADKPGNSKQEHEKHEVSVNNDHNNKDHTIYDAKEDSDIKSDDSGSKENNDHSVHEQDHTIYDTKEDSDIKSEDSSSKENSEEIDKADTVNGSTSDENEDWVKTISTLFKKFGFRDDQIPEPFGTKKTNDIEEPSPEFGIILQSLISNVPPHLKQQLEEILHSNGFKDMSVNSQDETHLLTKLGKTVEEVQNSFGHETIHSSVSESHHVKISSKSKSSDESKHSRKHDENSYQHPNRQQQLMPQGSSQTIQHNNENTQLKLNIDAETNKIKKEISEIAQLELIRHQKHQTGERDAKETNKINQLITDIHDLGEKEKLQKQQLLGLDHFVAQNGNTQSTAGNTYKIDEHNDNEDSSGNSHVETKSSHEHHDYIDHANGALSSVDIHKTVKTNSGHGHGHHETASDGNNIFQDVKKIVDEEIAEGNKLNYEHKRHKAEMMEVIRKLKFSDTSEEDKERIETIQNIIEQIDREHYKELDLQMKLDALVQSHEEGHSRRSANSNVNHDTNTVELDELKEKIKYNDHIIHKYLPPISNHRHITSESGRSHKTEHESSAHNGNNIELTEKFHHIKKTRKGSKHHEDYVEGESNEVIEENHHKPLSPEPNSYTENVSSHQAESNSIHNDFGTQHQQQEFQGTSLEHHEQSNYIEDNSGFDSEINTQMTEETIHETIQEQTDKPLATVNFQHFIQVPIGSNSVTQSEIEQFSQQGNYNYDSSNEQSAQAQYSQNYDYDVNNQFGNYQQEVGHSNNLESTNSEISSNHVPSSSSNDASQYHYGSGNSQSSGEVAGGIVYKNDVLHQREHDTMSNSMSHENHGENGFGSTGGDYHENIRQGHKIVGSGKSNSVDANSNSELEDVQEAIRNLEDILQSLESTAHMENNVEKVLDEGPQFSDGKQLHAAVVHDQSQGHTAGHDLSPEYLENVIRQEEAGEVHPHQKHHIQEHGDAIKWKRNAQNKKSVVRVKVDRKRT